MAGGMASILRCRRAAQVAGIALALLSLSVVALSARPSNDSRQGNAARGIGQAIPAFHGPQLAEDRRPFASDMLRGKVWVLNVWASWCGPCRLEHPVVQELAKGGIVVGLNYLDQRADALQWLTKAGDPFAYTVFDPDGAVGQALGLFSVPETYVIDAEGVIRYHHIGPIGPGDVKAEIAPLVKRLRRVR